MSTCDLLVEVRAGTSAKQPEVPPRVVIAERRSLTVEEGPRIHKLFKATFAKGRTEQLHEAYQELGSESESDVEVMIMEQETVSNQSPTNNKALLELFIEHS